jgi:muconolactone delta-isomerase
MRKWMVSLTFTPKPGAEAEAMALVPQEREQVDQMMREGKVLSRHIAEDNARVWLVVAGDTRTEVESLLRSLPMHHLFDREIWPLAE